MNPDFSWAPDGSSLREVAENNDSVLITTLGMTHPVMMGLTNAGLSNWNNSQHNYFSATASLDVLATDPSNRAAILAGNFGTGRVVYLGMDPSYHQPTGQSVQLIRQAARWAANVMPPESTAAGIALGGGDIGSNAIRTIATPTHTSVAVGDAAPRTALLIAGAAPARSEVARLDAFFASTPGASHPLAFARGKVIPMETHAGPDPLLGALLEDGDIGR